VKIYDSRLRFFFNERITKAHVINDIVKQVLRATLGPREHSGAFRKGGDC